VARWSAVITFCQQVHGALLLPAADDLAR